MQFQYNKKTTLSLPTTTIILHRILFARNGQKNNLNAWGIKAKVGIDAFQVAPFRWKDGKPFFDTSTSHLHNMQETTGEVPHTTITKWKDNHAWQSNKTKLWQETWHPSRAQKENGFLWQMIYRVPTTQQ